jgi:L-amino acid N-acyltransferase YncA
MATDVGRDRNSGNVGSIALHRYFGFLPVGTLRSVGLSTINGWIRF